MRVRMNEYVFECDCVVCRPSTRSAWMPTSNSDEEGGRLTTDYRLLYRYSKTKQTLMRLGIISYIDYCHSFKLSDNRN